MSRKKRFSKEDLLNSGIGKLFENFLKGFIKDFEAKMFLAASVGLPVGWGSKNFLKIPQALM